MKPVISVIMPVADGAAYIRQSIDSILAQSFGAFEFIVVDDGSTDGTSEILKTYAARDTRLRIIPRRRSGVAVSLNAGIAAAEGEYIARMDADDIALPARFERQLAFLAAHPQVVVVGTGMRSIDARGRTLERRRYPASHAGIVERLRAGDNALAHPTILIRREAMLAAGGYDVRYRHSEDYELWLRMSDTFALANLDEILLLYRIHPASVSAQHGLEQTFATWAAIAARRQRLAGGVGPFAPLPGLTPEAIPQLGLDDREMSALRLGVAVFALQVWRTSSRDMAPEIGRYVRHLLPGSQTARLLDVAAALIAASAQRAPRSARLARGMASLAQAFAADGKAAQSRHWIRRACACHPQGFAGVLLYGAGRMTARALRPAD